MKNKFFKDPVLAAISLDPTKEVVVSETEDKTAFIYIDPKFIVDNGQPVLDGRYLISGVSPHVGIYLYKNETMSVEDDVLYKFTRAYDMDDNVDFKVGVLVFNIADANFHVLKTQLPITEKFNEFEADIDWSEI